MLMEKMPIKMLAANSEQEISLNPGLRCHYKVYSKDQPGPLRIQIVLDQGINSTYISLSESLERPNRNKNDKVFMVANNHSPLTYGGEKESIKFFQSKYIYITVECEKECFGVMKVSFGKLKPKVRGSVLQKNEELKDFTISDPITSRNFIKKRFFTLRKQTVTTYKSKMKHHYVNEKGHRQKVLISRDLKQDKDVTMALLKYNRKRINEIYNAIIEEKTKELSNINEAMRLWVTIIRAKNFGIYLYKHFMYKKREKEASENVYFTKMRIKIKFHPIIKEFSNEFKDRMGNRISM